MHASRTFTLTLITLVLVGLYSMAQARYLPTRSDDARREQIKEVLRALLELTPEDRLFGRPGYPYDYRDESHLAKRSVVSNPADSFRHHDDQMAF